MTPMAGQPLPVNSVIQKVDSVLSIRGLGNISFIIAGSYPAAIKAFVAGLLLPYNDIDVYVLSGTKPDETETFIESIDNQQVTIQGRRIEINIMTLGWRLLDLGRLINGFDINAIKVGFIVQAGSGVPVWDVRDSFRLFLLTRQLEIDDIANLEHPASAVVRLLRKAEQLENDGINYSLPEEELLRSTLHNRCIRLVNFIKYENLGAKYKAEIDRRFFFEERFWAEREVQLFSFQRRDGGGGRPLCNLLKIDPYEAHSVPTVAISARYRLILYLSGASC